MDKPMNKQPSFQLSADVVLVAQMLRDTAIGCVVSYDEIRATIGRDPRGPARAVLNSARAVVQRDNRMVFSTVPTVGLRRLSDVEIVKTGDSDIAKIGRAARRGQKRLISVNDFSALPRQDQVKHNQTLSMLGAIGHFSKPAKVAAISVERPTTSGLPIGNTLKQFTTSEGV